MGLARDITVTCVYGLALERTCKKFSGNYVVTVRFRKDELIGVSGGIKLVKVWVMLVWSSVSKMGNWWR